MRKLWLLVAGLALSPVGISAQDKPVGSKTQS